MPGNNSDRWRATHSNPEYAQKVLEEFYPDRHIREKALWWLASSLMVAHDKNEQGWMVSLDPQGYGKRAACLNVGVVWAVDLYPSCVKLLLLEAELAPQTRAWLEGNNRLEAGQKGAKGSCSVIPDFAELQSIDQIYASVVEAHFALIRREIGSRKVLYHKNHSPGLLEYMRQLGLVVPDPDYSSVRPDTTQPLLFGDSSDGQEPEPGPDQEYWELSLDQLRHEAMQPPPFGADATVVQRINYRRSSAVRIYVMERADGRCEGCESPAPFVKSDGRPYLEAHHTQRISDGGPDHPEWVIALCPTCHRRVHHANDGQDYNVCLKIKAKQLELTCRGEK